MKIMDEDMMVNGGEQRRQGEVVMPQRRLFICKYCDRRFTSSHAFCGHQNSHRDKRAAMSKEASSHRQDTPLGPTVPAYNSPIMPSNMQFSLPLRNRRFQPYHHLLQILTYPRCIIPPPPGHPVLGSRPFGGYGPPRHNAAAAAAAVHSMGPKSGGPVMRQTMYDLRFEELVKAREAAEAEKNKEREQEEKEEELDLTLHL